MTSEINIMQAPQRTKYEFIDGIRCITMMFIVAEHCFAYGADRFAYGTDLYWAFLLTYQIFKFGTAIFFLLAGFLIGENFKTYSPLQYLKRRVSSTVWPWFIWSMLYILIDIIRVILLSPMARNPAFMYYDVFANIKGLYTYSNYWFIINFMLSISILLTFRKYLYSIYLGIILGVFTLFYSVNIYYQWIFPNHTTAILGFVFFLWLGAQIRRHWTAIEKLRDRIPVYAILLVVFVTYCLAVYETTILEGRGGDRFNSIRLSNILYSLACFALMLKVKSFKLISYLRPRETTFGIYLIHFILLVFFVPLIFPKVQLQYLSVTQFVLYKFSWFLVTYGLTYGMVAFLNRSDARILVGN